MKMKKIAAAALAAVMVLSMTACGDSEKPNGSGGAAANLSGNGDSEKPNGNGGAAANSNGNDSEFPFGLGDDDVSEPPKQISIWDIMPEIDVTDASAFKYKYNSELGGMVVTDYLRESPKVRIPDKLEGEPVVKVNFSEVKKSLTQIVMPDSVKEFSLSGTIEGALQYVNIPDSMDTIYYNEFSFCSKLTNVYISNSITHIADGKHAMEGDPGVIYNYSPAFEGCTNIQATYKGKTYDYEHIGALYDAINWGESGMIIENGVLKEVSIGLTEVVIPDSVTKIDSKAFEDCTSLTIINVADGNSKYYSIDGLLYEKTDDGGTLLSKCPIVRSGSINIPDDVTKIGGGAFEGCTSLTSVTIPNSVTKIGDKAFKGCASLTNVTIGNGVTGIGDNAFEGCASLTNVTIGNGVTWIGDKAFSGCKSLTSVTIPNSVTYIGGEAFKGCASLTSIIMPNSLTRISESTFGGCENLTNVVIPDSVNYIFIYNESTPFNGCKNVKVTYKGKTYDYKKLDRLYDVINLGESGMLIKEGVLKDVSMELTELIIPDSVKTIDKDAFKNCSDLTSITTGKGMIEIGEYAFSNLGNLKNMTISDGTTEIGDGAFAGCRSLTSISVPSSVKWIGQAAFSGCESLTSITLPVGVRVSCEHSYYVGYGTFEGSNIIEVICEGKTYSVEEFYEIQRWYAY